MTRVCVLELTGDVRAVRSARAFVRAAAGQDVDDDLIDDAVVVASELVTNAVLHAGTGSSLEVRVEPGRVEVRVSDGDPRPPVRRTLVGGLPAQGRGLALLSALAERWGVDEREGGKTVWAVLRAS